ncbi:flagellar basal body P-ring formation chaperone FlgA [Aurantimonas sp. MSK8Z-1]|uniref:flagellar basal body P-ring formation chaperone FlgA n=1 Tax=Mangrovibrevibacter kandeliae TaxID=2968473 RepID=UPI0021175E8D|nr:flagellar basal body P-ring formation chaperone FlgA [Aurantimonas sp. MSK8Z-1]MCW4113699.1 flagellar basal body P-ring formation chaperone FlgA [Aurantimonas sp. MSK8Z-1]
MERMAHLAALLLALALMLAPGRVLAADIELPVPTAIIYPGQAVLDRGVEQRKFRVPGDRLSAYVVEDQMLEGKLARRTLLPGEPILLADLKMPDLVKAGVATAIVYRDAVLTITSVGTPLRSAGAGEVVRVRNDDSGVIITGTVAEDGSIEVSTR